MHKDMARYVTIANFLYDNCLLRTLLVNKKIACRKYVSNLLCNNYFRAPRKHNLRGKNFCLVNLFTNDLYLIELIKVILMCLFILFKPSCHKRPFEKLVKIKCSEPGGLC